MTDPNTRVSVTEAFADGSVIEQIRKLKAGKQDKLVAGPGIEIAADGKTISTDAAAPNWGQIEGELSDQTDLNDALVDLQTAIEALEDEVGAVGEAGTIRDDIDQNAQAILTKAADSTVVHLAGDDTITGLKKFTRGDELIRFSMLNISDMQAATPPATAETAYIPLRDVTGKTRFQLTIRNDSNGNRILSLSSNVNTRGQTTDRWVTIFSTTITQNYQTTIGNRLNIYHKTDGTPSYMTGPHRTTGYTDDDVVTVGMLRDLGIL